MKIFLLFCLLVLSSQLTMAQVLRPPFNLLNRAGAETIVETGNYIPTSSSKIFSDQLINNYVPIPNAASEGGTTIITDCSPTICKNLANTIQLMIVCNLLQNTNGGADIALQLAGPIINEVLSMPTLSCGCNNPIASNMISPNIVSPSFLAPNAAQLSANIVGPNAVPLTPTIVPSSNINYPNMPNIGTFSPSLGMPGQIPNRNELMNTLMSLLGNVKM